MQQAEIVSLPTPQPARRRPVLAATTVAALAAVAACHCAAPAAFADGGAVPPPFELTLAAPEPAEVADTAESADTAGPGELAPWNEAFVPHLQLEQPLEEAEPGQADVGTTAYDYRVPSWYTRFGVNVVFPQDIEFEGVEADFTLGWGGGLYAALGYNFNAGEPVSTRLEGEYQLRLNDYRDAIDDSVTWNSLGFNGLIDFAPFEQVPQMKLYGGLGAGLVYATVNDPTGPGSDDAVTPYYQVMGGALVRFSEDIDIDFGLRWQQTVGLEVFETETDLQNIVFHIGLLLRLE